MQRQIYKMEFTEVVETLRIKHDVDYGQLFDYMKFDLGPRLFWQHIKIGLSDKKRFEQLRIDITEHELRNGYLQQHGYKLERIVNQEAPKYSRQRST